MFDIQDFARAQIPPLAPALPISTSIPLTPTEKILALQLANMYGLMGMVGIAVLYYTTETRVVRNYLIACAIADVGHVGVTGVGMGWERFVDVGGWNKLAWGNVGVTSFLFVSRCAYLAGLLGGDRVVDGGEKEGKKKV